MISWKFLIFKLYRGNLQIQIEMIVILQGQDTHSISVTIAPDAFRAAWIRDIWPQGK